MSDRGNTTYSVVIDNNALVTALHSGNIDAAVIEVFNGEPANISRGYHELDNTFLLPYIDSTTAETRVAMDFAHLMRGRNRSGQSATGPG